MPKLIEALREAFRNPCTSPGRQIASIPGGAGDRLLLYMSAFDSAGGGVVKLATVFPDNTPRGLPTIHAALVVFSATGMPVAMLDGTMVTKLRTAAASALASEYLSRADSAHLLIVGTGALAPYMALAHCTVRPIRRVSVSGRNATRTSGIAQEIRSFLGDQILVDVTDSVEQCVADADIVSCATSSVRPILQGAWIRPGTFIDLVGSFSPTKREADDEVVRRSRLFVDTFEGALSEAGDLLDPIHRGVIGRERIEGELADLIAGRVVGRRAPGEITLFKSVGSALEDLAAAQLIMAQTT